jgi:uncharacterized membrane protein YdbT with pleckstrin-like domain
MAQHYIDKMLGEREKILDTARQHWFILARNIVAEIFSILILFSVTVFAAIYLNSRYQVSYFLSILVGFVLMLLPVISMIRDFLIWSNRQYLITNRRVIQISGVINKNVTDSSLEKVNDLIMTQSALGRICNYGDIEILTASELGVNKIKQIEKPVRFKLALINAKEALERSMTSEPQREELSVPALIEQLDQLRQKGTLTEEEFQEKKAQLLSKL